MNEQELLILKEELDKERRKSQMDEEKIKKLEDVLEKNVQKAEEKLRILNEELERERRRVW